MSLNNSVNQDETSSNHGGKREGAGRRGLVKSLLRDPKHARARGIDPVFAGIVLDQVIDERKAWQRIFQSEDDRIILQALMYLTSMRDGKPAQAINVTSTNLNISSRDISKARDIVREIRDGMSTSRLAQSNTIDAECVTDNDEGETIAESEAGHASPLMVDATPTRKGEVIVKANPMLSGDEGGIKGGRGVVWSG